MSDEQHDRNDYVLSGPQDVQDMPDPDDLDFPVDIEIEPLGLGFTVIAPTPAQNFQWTNQHKFSNDNIDLEGLVKKYWTNCMQAKNGQKPSLFSLQGTDQKDEGFTIILNFFRRYFLGKT
jgi:hypothetical protein